MSLSGAAVVTGATGFVGRNLVRRLLDVGLEVTSLLRESSTVPDSPSDADAFRHARIVRWDWQSGAAPPNVRADWVFHLAAAGVKPAERDPDFLRRANVDYPVRMARLAGEWGARFVLAGSSAEYADPPDRNRLSEGSPVQRDRQYGATKVLGTEAVLTHARDVGFPAVCCRLFGIYGPGEAAYRLFPTAVVNLTANRPVALSTGTQVRDFLSVTDACSGLMAAAVWLSGQKGTMGNGIMNLCTGEGCQVREFAEDIAGVLGRARSLIEAGRIPLRPDDVPYLVGDPTLLMERTGWAPTPRAIALAREIERMTEDVE
jgi:nucleoside-diphosphate-sugar epimerase